jgi:1-deoxyxylulose-5-phosphate synthase
MTPCSRRRFLKTGLAAGSLLTTASLPVLGQKGKATDWVTLGKSGVKVTRLAFGTGSMGGRVQRELGQDEFTRQVRYAYDRGIRFFETLKGIPRDTYRIMSKVTTREGVDMQTKIDDLRRLAQTDYFDILLLHYQHFATWPTDSLRWQDSIAEAQHKKAVVGRGASVHGLPALRQMPGNKWLEVAMIRMNHNGTKMDGEAYNTPGPGNVVEAVQHTKTVHTEGMGVISMKLVGEGAFTNRADRQTAMKFAFQKAGVDSVTVGFKSTAEIDEAIENLNLALA